MNVINLLMIATDRSINVINLLMIITIILLHFDKLLTYNWVF